MSRFGSDPRAFFKAVYQNIAPWDIGAPQPAMAALITTYPPTGPILDIGCGSGDLAIYLAQLGHQVVGIDFVESAIKSAQDKVSSLPPETAQLLSFQVADALKPSLLQKSLERLWILAFIICLDSNQCDQLIDEVASILRPNGCYYLHEFAIEFPVPNVPRQITVDELQARFTVEKGWHIREIQTVEFLSQVAPPVPATCACIERLPT